MLLIQSNDINFIFSYKWKEIILNFKRSINCIVISLESHFENKSDKPAFFLKTHISFAFSSNYIFFYIKQIRKIVTSWLFEGKKKLFHLFSGNLTSKRKLCWMSQYLLLYVLGMLRMMTTSTTTVVYDKLKKEMYARQWYDIMMFVVS